MRGASITIIERRPPWNPDFGPEWSRLEVAQLRYDDRAGRWRLYFAGSDDRWHAYEFAAPAADVASLLDAIEPDSTGIFSAERRRRELPSAPLRPGGEFPASAPTGVMGDRPTPMDPDEAERRFADMLDERGLPRFAFTVHDPAIDELQLTWEHGFTIHLDLTRLDESPIDDLERAAILGLAPDYEDHGPIHVYVPGSVDDPRDTPSIPGVVIHRGPALHRDDVTTHLGIPVTSPSRTLIDLAEVMTAAELRAAFTRAREIGLLDPEALRAARARVEWRPSLAMLDEMIDEFCGRG